MAGRYLILSAEALDAVPEIGPAAFVVLAALASFSDKQGRSFPSIKKLAARAACSERTAQDALSRLRRAGLVKAEPRKAENGRSTSNEFFLTAKARPMVGCGKLHPHPAASRTHRVQPAAPLQQEPSELEPLELEVTEDVDVFVSKESWQETFDELRASLPRNTTENDFAFIGQIAYLLRCGAKIWPNVRDAIERTKLRKPAPKRPVAYLRTILNGTIGHETLANMLRRGAPTVDESRRQVGEVA